VIVHHVQSLRIKSWTCVELDFLACQLEAVEKVFLEVEPTTFFLGLKQILRSEIQTNGKNFPLPDFNQREVNHNTF
jgi:hypothetical protein